MFDWLNGLSDPWSMTQDPASVPMEAAGAPQVPTTGGDWRPDWLKSGVDAIKQFGAGGGGAGVPELVANAAKSAGIGPGQLLGGESPNSFLQAPAPPLGESLNPASVPLPTPRPYGAGATPATNTMSAAAQKPSSILDSLKGVKAPAAPQAQSVKTPNAPLMQPHASIKTGQLLALLQAIGAGGAAAPKVPLPLGAAIGGR